MRRPSLVLLPTLLLSALAFAGLSAQQGEDPDPAVKCPPVDPVVSDGDSPCDGSLRHLEFKECDNDPGQCWVVMCVFSCTFAVKMQNGDILTVYEWAWDDDQWRVAIQQQFTNPLDVYTFAIGRTVPCGYTSQYSMSWLSLSGESCSYDFDLQCQACNK